MAPSLTMDELLAIPGLTRAGDDDADESRKRKAQDDGEEEEEEEEEEAGPGEGDDDDEDDETEDVVHKRAKSSGVGGDGVVLHTLDDDTTMGVVKIPTRHVGNFIGKGGWGIKTLTGTTGVRLNVEADGPHNVGGVTRDVELTGTPSQVAAAGEVIVARIDELERHERRQQGRGSDDDEELDEPDAINKILIAAPELVAAVVGRKGATIKAIRQLSGARMNMVDEVGVGTFACLAGSNEAVGEATAMVRGVMGFGGGGLSKSAADAAHVVDAAHEYARELVARAETETAEAEAAAAARAGATAEATTTLGGEGNHRGGDGGQAAAGSAGHFAGAAARAENNAGVGAGAAAADWGPWRTMASRHPDGSAMFYYYNTDTGQSQFHPPQLPGGVVRR